MWDVRYANATRGIPPAEQHVHGILEMTPAIATAVVAILHWPQFLSLFGAGEARFTLELKHAPLPGWYLGSVMLGVLFCGVLPYAKSCCARRGPLVSPEDQLPSRERGVTAEQSATPA